jgi:hypothetical protein
MPLLSRSAGLQPALAWKRTVFTHDTHFHQTPGLKVIEKLA